MARQSVDIYLRPTSGASSANIFQVGANAWRNDFGQAILLVDISLFEPGKFNDRAATNLWLTVDQAREVHQELGRALAEWDAEQQIAEPEEDGSLTPDELDRAESELDRLHAGDPRHAAERFATAD